MKRLMTPEEYRESLERLETQGKRFWLENSPLYPTLDRELMKSNIPFNKAQTGDIWVLSEEDRGRALDLMADIGS